MLFRSILSTKNRDAVTVGDALTVYKMRMIVNL